MDENLPTHPPAEEGIENAQTMIQTGKRNDETKLTGEVGKTVSRQNEPSLLPPVPEPQIAGREKPTFPQENRPAAWLQFPRRFVFLLVSAALSAGIILGLQRWTDYELTRAELEKNTMVLWEALPNTLMVLFGVLLTALLAGLLPTLIGVLIHWLESRAGLAASVFKGLGRLWIFSAAGVPVICAAYLLLYIFAAELDLFPSAGLYSLSGTRSVGEVILHLILPVTAVSLYPAILTAQAATREITLPRHSASARAMLAGILKGLSTLLGQSGGILSAILIAEVVFHLPGIGSAMFSALMHNQPDFLFRGMFALAIVTLLGRLLSELLAWVGRLVNEPAQVPQLTIPRSRATARLVWVIFCLLLLAVPIFIAIRAGGIPERLAVETNPQVKSQSPSEIHPWGTDGLGRDGLARAYLGTRNTLWRAILAAGVILLPALIGGAIFAFLHSLKRWWSESLTDLLLIPTDSLLLLPALPFYLTLYVGIQRKGIAITWESITILIGILLLPRAMRVFQAMWTPVYRFRPPFLRFLPALGSLIFGAIFAGFTLLIYIDSLGLGIPPTEPSIGSLMMDSIQQVRLSPNLTLGLGCVLMIFGCLFPLYLAADALAGYFTCKEGMARLNE